MNIDNLINSLFGSSEAIWTAIKKYAIIGSREATRMMLQMYYCLMSPETPALDKAIIIGGLAYQLLPKDVLSTKKYGLLGLLDNGLTLALAYNKVYTNITPEINNQVDAILGQWFPSTGGAEKASRAMPSLPEVIPTSTSTNPKDIGTDDELIID